MEEDRTLSQPLWTDLKKPAAGLLVASDDLRVHSELLYLVWISEVDATAT